MASTVYYKRELETALKNKNFPITVKGKYAADAIASSFMGGTSLIGSTAGLTIGFIALITGELAILCGFTHGMTGLLMHRKERLSLVERK